MNRRLFLKSGMMLGAISALGSFTFACDGKQTANNNAETNSANNNSALDDDTKLPFKKIVKTDAEWKNQLTSEQYRVARQAGTEAPYSSPLNNIHSQGTFTCVCCDLPVFSSKTKFDSGTGWPSFYAPIAKINVSERVDRSLPSEVRTEVLCNRCDAHLGHVFDDGPKPTGLRYCMNGVAMKFIKT